MGLIDYGDDWIVELVGLLFLNLLGLCRVDDHHLFITCLGKRRLDLFLD